jgi:hypothetical protein
MFVTEIVWEDLARELARKLTEVGKMLTSLLQKIEADRLMAN